MANQYQTQQNTLYKRSFAQAVYDLLGGPRSLPQQNLSPNVMYQRNSTKAQSQKCCPNC